MNSETIALKIQSLYSLFIYAPHKITIVVSLLSFLILSWCNFLQKLSTHWTFLHQLRKFSMSLASVSQTDSPRAQALCVQKIYSLAHYFLATEDFTLPARVRTYKEKVRPGVWLFLYRFYGYLVSGLLACSAPTMFSIFCSLVSKLMVLLCIS